MNILGFQDETDMKLVAPSATDEALVAAAKLGNHQAFAELWTRHSNTHSRWPIESWETETR